MTRFSYQLYSSRNFGPLSETLKMLAGLGYVAVEGFGGVYTDAAALRAELDAVGLTMPTGHFGIDQLEGDVAGSIKTAQTLGMTSIFCPYLEAPMRPTTPEGYLAFGKRLQEASKPYADAGLNFGWHNHDFEFAALADGSLPHDRIFEGGPNLAWEADIAWIERGGADPLQYIERYKDRLIAVHVKDIAPAGECADEDGWSDVGHGVMDWAGILAALKNTPTQHFIMEHDNPSDDQRFASRSVSAASKF